MQDSELKNLLLETCPVRPGQEERAWTALRDRLLSTGKTTSAWSWLYYPTWRGLAVACVTLVAIPFIGNLVYLRYQPLSFATADSKSPGIYATAFYSHSAKAQVVWLNGMEPASDTPSYMDPTTAVPAKNVKPEPARDPNSL